MLKNLGGIDAVSSASHVPAKSQAYEISHTLNPKNTDLLRKFRGGSRAAATSKMEHFVIIVNGWKSLTIITKRSILDVAAALDPPLKLIEKQQSDGCTEDSDIQKIQANQVSYDIVLFNKRNIKNIANFCCTDRKEIKSALCWDFTFDLGKSLPYYLLALSY